MFTLILLMLSRDALTEVTQGIKEYFNVMLGTQLLYKFERQQYAEVINWYMQVIN